MQPPRIVDPCASSVRAVVFDLDGTLLDSSDIKVSAYYSTMRDFVGGNGEAHERAYGLFGTLNREQQLAGAHRYCVGSDAPPEKLVAMTDAYRAACRERMAAARLFADFDVMCEALAGSRLAVASNAPVAEVVDVLARLGVLGQFERCYGYPVPKADALRALAAEWQVEPSELLYVGDRPEDGRAADEAGTQFRLIDHTGEAPYGRDRLIQSFQQLAAEYSPPTGLPDQ